MLQFGIITIYCYFTIMDSLIIEKLGSGYSLIGVPVLHDLLMINQTVKYRRFEC